MSKLFPWTAPLPDTGSGRAGSACGCSGDSITKLNRLVAENFGDDVESEWVKIPRTFAGKFITIGPQSEWDACVIHGAAGGPLAVGVGAPAFIPLDNDVVVRPLHTLRSKTTGNMKGRLELIVADSVPHWAHHKRVARLYPTFECAALSSVAETALYLKTEWTGSATVGTIGVQTALIVTGARRLTLYMRNNESSAIDWRMVGGRFHANTVSEHPIDPTGYPDSAPTYNSLAADSYEIQTLDLDASPVDWVRLYAKATAAGTITMFVGAQVND